MYKKEERVIGMRNWKREEGLKRGAELLRLITCDGTKEGRTLPDREKWEMRNWINSARERGMEREEGRTDGVREGKGKQTWGKRQEEMRGLERGEARVGCWDGWGRGDWLFSFDSMCQIDCGWLIQLVMAEACRRGTYGGVMGEVVV